MLGVFGREITNYMVRCGAYVRVCPTLLIFVPECLYMCGVCVCVRVRVRVRVRVGVRVGVGVGGCVHACVHVIVWNISFTTRWRKWQC
jgi:hypothetical protein